MQFGDLLNAAPSEGNAFFVEEPATNVKHEDKTTPAEYTYEAPEEGGKWSIASRMWPLTSNTVRGIHVYNRPLEAPELNDFSSAFDETWCNLVKFWSAGILKLWMLLFICDKWYLGSVDQIEHPKIKSIANSIISFIKQGKRTASALTYSSWCPIRNCLSIWARSDEALELFDRLVEITNDKSRMYSHGLWLAPAMSDPRSPEYNSKIFWQEFYEPAAWDLQGNFKGKITSRIYDQQQRLVGDAKQLLQEGDRRLTEIDPRDQPKGPNNAGNATANVAQPMRQNVVAKGKGKGTAPSAPTTTVASGAATSSSVTSSTGPAAAVTHASVQVTTTQAEMVSLFQQFLQQSAVVRPGAAAGGGKGSGRPAPY